MTEPTSSNPSRPKRSRGRPGGGADQYAGREALIAAARRLLAVEPPAKVTTAAIAREAAVDPALVRYHFGDRQHLLLAVVEDIMAKIAPARPPPNTPPAERLAWQARGAMQLARSARSMQRLMVEELAGAKSPEIRARITAMNANAIGRYEHLLSQDNAVPLEPVEPLFMFIAMIGMAEFFATAEPVIRPHIPAGADFDELTERYTTFMVKLILDGLRPR